MLRSGNQSRSRATWRALIPARSRRERENAPPGPGAGSDPPRDGAAAPGLDDSGHVGRAAERRQPEGDRGAAPAGALGPDAAAVGLHVAPRDGQAETGPTATAGA